MELKKLEIEKVGWGEFKGQFRGKITFANELGAVSMILTPERCQELFMVCADGVIDTAKAAAQELTCTVIEHKAAIESDTEQES